MAIGPPAMGPPAMGILAILTLFMIQGRQSESARIQKNQSKGRCRISTSHPVLFPKSRSVLESRQPTLRGTFGRTRRREMR
ncbi:hypothetical protein RRF57_004474 [Xylaria bambusicola]|uniref:Secreted protein n=1 Tax=Xylaria bambusicola TaxID=326684 RepID=A0AAN7UWB2_9PEZI